MFFGRHSLLGMIAGAVLVGCSLIGAIPTWAQTTPSPKIIFAHMVNTESAVNWALLYDINGVEVDLRFDEDKNMLSEFKHSIGLEPCDCSLPDFRPTDPSVCNFLSTTSCHASTDAATLLHHLANPGFSQKLAVIYIDSKLYDHSPKDHAEAGRNVVGFLDAHLFGKGYQGQVIIRKYSIG